MNHAETAVPQFVRALPRLLIGLAVMSVGLLWTLDNLDFVESEAVTRWWPVVVIAVGLARLADPRANRIVSVIIILVGAGWLLDALNVWDFDIGDLFPLLIAVVGAKLVMDTFRRRHSRMLVPAGEADATLQAFAFLSGVTRRSISSHFRGGEANAIMGGVELDLRNAQIGDGEEAVIDVFAFWGGVEIRVPENWRVAGEVLPLMGAFEDSTASKTALAAGPALVIRGAAVMGGIEVKN